MVKRWWKLGLLIIILAALGAWAYELIAVRGTFEPFQSIVDAGGSAVVAGAPGHRVVGRVYVTGTPMSSAPLIVVLHGDAPFISCFSISRKAIGFRYVAGGLQGKSRPCRCASKPNSSQREATFQAMRLFTQYIL